MHGGETAVILGGGLLVIALFLVGYLGWKIRVPSVVLYIILGIVIGSFMSTNEVIDIAGKIGIVFLFFLLGLEFPINRLGETAKKVWPAGVLDIILSLGVTTLICNLFGLGWIPSFLIGGAVYATSSSITANLLERTKRIANLEGEYMLGLLIFEDLIAPIVIAVLIGLTSGEQITVLQFLILLIKIILLTLGAILIGKFGFSKLGKVIERINDEDIFILLSAGISLSYAGLSLYLGLSEVLGAFLAGMMLAETNKMEDFESTTVSVRDLLLPVFFFSFGMTVDLSNGVPMVWLLIVLLVWSILAKVVTGMWGGQWYGLPKRVSMRAGLSLTQRGEFSVVIATLMTGTVKIFTGIYILGSAMIGIGLFLLAPKITRTLYGKPKKDIKMPGS
ncbi:cation:proton antiporter [Tuberibacillus sp. Marseille-P3662]|uniref:cation:proton antiporter n=1 Tax=Tuberibacillus sp. Marseille-P3662 TaxID=1965358 RepID=UPI000A1C9585|nr:cation:proton antiporter [Tuberibacillus sp. Marseille-P3662]